MIIKTISTFFAKLSGLLLYISRLLYISPHEKRVRYFKNNTDKYILVNYPLTENSIVFDVGGYEGQWASDIFSRYQCNIYIFEPVPNFSKQIAERFKYNSKIKVFKFGLGNTDHVSSISLAEDQSSLFVKNTNCIEVKIRNIATFIELQKIQNIDLISINIEGGEYDLLEKLIKTKLINRINNIQVQFHSFLPNSESRMKSIQNKLKTTHKLTYQYPFVWENWQRIN